MDKVYVVTCSLNESYSEQSWVVSVHRTEATARESVRELYEKELREQLENLLASDGSYRPEMRYIWRVETHELN